MKRSIFIFPIVLIWACGFAAASVPLSMPLSSLPAFRACSSSGFGPAFAEADAAFNLGQAAADAGRHQEAIEYFNKAIALNPNDACAHNNLGVEQEAAGLPDQAMQSYDRAITLDPSLADAWENRGNMYLDRGETARAEIDFAHADLADQLHTEI